MTVCRQEWRDRASILAILGVGFFMRVYRLAYHGLWIDEGYSVHLAGLPPADVVAGTAADQHPPLYYLLLHIWLRMAGDSEYAVRFLSVVLGVVTVALVYTIGRHLCNTTCGAWAALLLAISPLHIRYSQETRMYVLLALLAALSVYSLHKWSSRQTARRAVAYVVSTAAALYTHNFSLFLLLFQGVWILVAALWRRQPGLAFRAFAMQGLVVLAWIPWVPTILTQARDHSMSWVGTPDLSAVRRTLLMLVTGARLEELGPIPQAAHWLWLALAAIALVLAWRRNRARRGGVLLIVSWFLIPAGVIVAAAMRYPLYQDKQFVFLLPALALVLAVAFSAIRPRWRLLLLAGLAALHIYPLYGLYQAWPRQDWRDAVSYLKEHSQVGDVIVLNPAASEIMLDYYQGPKLAHIGVPEEYDVLVGGFEGAVISRESATSKLAPLLDSPHRIWLLEFTPGFWDPEGWIVSWLERHASGQDRVEFADLTLRLFRID